MITDILQTAIADSDKSIYQIAKDAGVTAIMVSRFVRGERDIRLATADKLAAAVGLRVSGPAGRRRRARS